MAPLLEFCGGDLIFGLWLGLARDTSFPARYGMLPSAPAATRTEKTHL